MADDPPEDGAPPSRYVPPPIFWKATGGGRQLAEGEGWTADARPRPGGGWEVVLHLGGDSLSWPPPESPPKTDALCRAWVRRRLVADLERQRWTNYLGQPYPSGRQRKNWATDPGWSFRSWATASRNRRQPQSAAPVDRPATSDPPATPDAAPT